MSAGYSGRQSRQFLLLFAGIFLYVVLSASLFLVKENCELRNATFLLLNSVSEAVAFGGIYFILKHKPSLKFRFSPRDYIYGLTGWAIAFALSQAYFFFVHFLGLKPDFYQHEIFEGISGPANLFVAFLSVAILSPFFEELYFRGLLFSLYKDEYGFLLPAAGSSAVFGILHGGFYFFPLFLFGMVLCYLTEKTGSLGAALIAHGLNNALAFFYYLYLSGG